MLALIATLKPTCAPGGKTQQTSLTGEEKWVPHLHPQLDHLWITQLALVSSIHVLLCNSSTLHFPRLIS